MQLNHIELHVSTLFTFIITIKRIQISRLIEHMDVISTKSLACLCKIEELWYHAERGKFNYEIESNLHGVLMSRI